MPFCKETLPDKNQQENAYISIRGFVIEAQRNVYSAVNAAMVSAYWDIGKAIYEFCGESDRAAYGKQILHYISERLTAEFGKGYDESNLKNIHRFYLCFQIRHTLCL